MRLWFRLVTLFLSLGLAELCMAQSDHADTVFIGDHIYTVNAEKPWVEAVAITDGHIIYAGDSAGAQRLINESTDVRMLESSMLLPGFIDTHSHPILAAASMNFLSIDGDDDPATIYRKLKDYAEDNPELEVISGHGFNPAQFDEDPTRELLDRVVPDRPVFLIDSGGHLGWANGSALELAGIDKNTPDPVPGSHYYVRDEAGKPTGYMYEDATFAPFVRLDVGTSISELIANAETLFGLIISFGITSVFDASMEWLLDDGSIAVAKMERTGELPFRLVMSMTVERDMTSAEVIDRYRKFEKNYNGDSLKMGAIKFALDGTIEGHSAALFGQYTSGKSGALNWDPIVFMPLFRDLDKAGIDVHLHAIGDRAVNMALNAIEFARKANGFHGTRHTICHTEMVQAEDIPRFKQLDVIAQTTPAWHAESEAMGQWPVNDSERSRFFPFRSIAESGAVVTFGSDFPYGGGLETLIPLFNMQVGATRLWPGDQTSQPLPPAEEVLSLETLVRGYTLDAAYQLRLEDVVGSIEVGKSADLIVLSGNIFEAKTHTLHNITVNATMVNGELVYERPIYQWIIEWWLGL